MASKILRHPVFLDSVTSVLEDPLMIKSSSLHSNSSLILSHGVLEISLLLMWCYSCCGENEELELDQWFPT